MIDRCFFEVGWFLSTVGIWIVLIIRDGGMVFLWVLGLRDETGVLKFITIYE